MRVVLASKSPARLKTLQGAGIEPLVLVSDADEAAVLAALPGGRFGQGGSTTPADEVTALAAAKCHAVCASLIETHVNTDHPLAPSNPIHQVLTQLADETRLLVVGCDSMLEINGRMAGKPHTAGIARQRIQEMRNTEATLWTGHAVALMERTGIGRRWRQVKNLQRSAHTLVRFGSITDAEIEAYIATGEPLEVAGAFTVDALGGPFVSSIDGDFHSVVGISLPLIRDMARDLGIFWPDLWASRN